LIATRPGSSRSQVLRPNRDTIPSHGNMLYTTNPARSTSPTEWRLSGVLSLAYRPVVRSVVRCFIGAVSVSLSLLSVIYRTAHVSATHPSTHRARRRATSRPRDALADLSSVDPSFRMKTPHADVISRCPSHHRPKSAAVGYTRRDVFPLEQCLTASNLKICRHLRFLFVAQFNADHIYLIVVVIFDF